MRRRGWFIAIGGVVIDVLALTALSVYLARRFSQPGDEAELVWLDGFTLCVTIMLSLTGLVLIAAGAVIASTRRRGPRH